MPQVFGNDSIMPISRIDICFSLRIIPIHHFRSRKDLETVTSPDDLAYRYRKIVLLPVEVAVGVGVSTMISVMIYSIVDEKQDEAFLIT